jgi:Type II secretion system (T2SS), protein E, N-terminal domain
MTDSTALLTTVVPESDESSRAQALAHRYRCEFVDLKNFRIQHELFRSVPVDMMFRYNFVPLEQMEDRLVIAVSDPSRLMILDSESPPASRPSPRSPTCSKRRSSRSACSTRRPKGSRSM